MYKIKIKMKRFNIYFNILYLEFDIYLKSLDLVNIYYKVNYCFKILFF